MIHFEIIKSFLLTWQEQFNEEMTLLELINNLCSSCTKVGMCGYESIERCQLEGASAFIVLCPKDTSIKELIRKISDERNVTFSDICSLAAKETKKGRAFDIDKLIEKAQRHYDHKNSRQKFKKKISDVSESLADVVSIVGIAAAGMEPSSGGSLPKIGIFGFIPLGGH